MAKTSREKLEPFVPKGWAYDEWMKAIHEAKMIVIDDCWNIDNGKIFKYIEDLIDEKDLS
jgi:hypothetical protein